MVRDEVRIPRRANSLRPCFPALHLRYVILRDVWATTCAKRKRLPPTDTSRISTPGKGARDLSRARSRDARRDLPPRDHRGVHRPRPLRRGARSREALCDLAARRTQPALSCDRLGQSRRCRSACGDFDAATVHYRRCILAHLELGQVRLVDAVLHSVAVLFERRGRARDGAMLLGYALACVAGGTIPRSATDAASDLGIEDRLAQDLGGADDQHGAPRRARNLRSHCQRPNVRATKVLGSHDAACL